jgi:hypothetical protein
MSKATKVNNLLNEKQKGDNGEPYSLVFYIELDGGDNKRCSPMCDYLETSNQGFRMKADQLKNLPDNYCELFSQKIKDLKRCPKCLTGKLRQ